MTATEDLITRLAAATAPKAFNPLRLAALVLLAVVLPVALFLTVAGTRPELDLAWSNPIVPFKTFLPLTLCALALTLALRLTRPEAQPGTLPLWFLVPAGIAVALWVGAFITRAPDQRFAEVGLVSLAECLVIIPLLSIIPAATALRLLRRGASTSPTLTGALAGLAVGSGAASGYSLFCTRDNPLFFVTWYAVAIAIVTVISALAGRRLLRW